MNQNNADNQISKTKLDSDDNSEDNEAQVESDNYLSDIFKATLLSQMSNRIIYLFDDIEDRTVLEVIRQIHILESKDNSDIHLFINSDGGILQDCMALIDVMDSSNCDISTYSVGKAASAACLLSSNGTRGKRFAGKNAEFMFHELYGDIEDAKKTNLAYHKKQFARENDRVNSIFSKNTGKTVKEIKTMFYDSKQDNWIGAKDAVEFGIVDHIMTRATNKEYRGLI